MPVSSSQAPVNFLNDIIPGTYEKAWKTRPLLFHALRLSHCPYQ
ncbi:hypothetical protein HMPREF9442_03262 [Paraprevotella xylaniphila YIT 11841]|uniref:Uncharacterized protein n=1 Tax=Paraprevotella xylaniphila YIT 11841 TaxID=762982 RepID=F3QYG8_9BACT|nr:hypothetical protein HMPREF9442_03262 [Paraprevotella xylaniphila YIT 11841]